MVWFQVLDAPLSTDIRKIVQPLGAFFSSSGHMGEMVVPRVLMMLNEIGPPKCLKTKISGMSQSPS